MTLLDPFDQRVPVRKSDEGAEGTHRGLGLFDRRLVRRERDVRAPVESQFEKQRIPHEPEERRGRLGRHPVVVEAPDQLEVLLAQAAGLPQVGAGARGDPRSARRFESPNFATLDRTRPR